MKTRRSLDAAIAVDEAAALVKDGFLNTSGKPEHFTAHAGRAVTGEGNAPRNDPNANYGMYEQDRVAKEKAQSVTGKGSAARETSADWQKVAIQIKANFDRVTAQRDELLAAAKRVEAGWKFYAPAKL